MYSIHFVFRTNPQNVLSTLRGFEYSERIQYIFAEKTIRRGNFMVSSIYINRIGVFYEKVEIDGACNRTRHGF